MACEWASRSLDSNKNLIDSIHTVAVDLIPRRRRISNGFYRPIEFYDIETLERFSLHNVYNSINSWNVELPMGSRTAFNGK